MRPPFDMQVPQLKLSSLIALPLLAATASAAEQTRQLGVHEHGVGQLNIAIDGALIAMEFRAPGADIVGFEYPATSAADLATIDAALAQLSDPLALFTPPAAAGCTVTQAQADLDAEDDHDEAADHAEHEDQPNHTEFHAHYLLDCTNPAALTEITFNYFNIFRAAIEVEGQIITPNGAAAFEVVPDATTLDLTTLF